MKRLPVVLLSLLSLLLSGCGQVFVRGALNPDGSQAVFGTVSVVRLTIISDSVGTSITVTAVTLIEGGTSTSTNFCGDQRSQFPINHRIRANFMPSDECSNLIVVVRL